MCAEETRSMQSTVVQQIDLRDMPLAEALRMFSQQTGLNVVSSQDARKVQVSLFLRNVSAKSAIEELCKSHNLWYRQDDKSGVIRVMTIEEFQRELVTTKLEKTEVFTLMYPNAMPIAFAIRDLFGDRVQLSTGEETASNESRELEERLSRFDIIDQRSQGLGLFEGGGTTSNVGGAGSNRFNGSDSNSTSSSSSINRRTRRNEDSQRTQQPGQGEPMGELKHMTSGQAEAIQKVMESGKSPAEIQAALQVFQRQKADIYVTLSKRNNLVLVRTSDQESMTEIRELILRLDVPTAMVLLEVKVLSIELGDGFNSLFDYQFTDGVTSAGGFSAGNIQPPAADLLSGITRRTSPLALGGSGLRNGDLTFQFVNNNFRARMQLLEDKNRVTTVATPMLLTANNEVSRLFVGEERPIIRNISSQTVVNNNAVTSTPNTTIEFRPVGTTLLITPNINSDRTVTLRILQENSAINPRAATIPVVTSEGSLQEQPVDVVSTRTVSGTVIAKDNLMVAVGGLIEDSVRDQRALVPILGKIPVLGVPFRRVSNGRSRRELIILVRPHIMSTPCEAEAISKELLGELSLHPNIPDAKGTMKTYAPREVLLPSPAKNKKDAILRLDSLKHEDD